MAIVKFVSSNCPMNNIFPYAMKAEKTDGGTLVSGINCMPETAFNEFQYVKKKYGKEDGRQYYHIVQSFSPDDKLSPKTAHEIGLKFAEYFEGFQIVVSTHTDRNHIHNHLVVNSVNYENGRKFHQTKEDLARVKEFSNKLCLEYGLSTTETKSKFSSTPRWKELLRQRAFSTALNCRSKEDFIWEMTIHGYGVDWKDGHKYITFTTPDGHKCRDNKLFCEQLLRNNLEIYFLLGGCDSGLYDEFRTHVNYVNSNDTHTLSDSLFSLFKSLLEAIPPQTQYEPPVLPSQLDKLTVMELEALGIKIEPKALVYYSANEQQEEQEFGFYL